MKNKRTQTSGPAHRNKIEDTQQLLEGLEEYRHSKGLARTDMARLLGIKYSTVKKWFFSGSKKRIPNAENVNRIRAFISSETDTPRKLELRWERIKQWWETQHSFDSVESLADEAGWSDRELHRALKGKSVPSRLVIEKVEQLAGLDHAYPADALEKAIRRTEKAKSILNLLYDELAWFRDSSKEIRDLYRAYVDKYDSGYLSSLLTMIQDEGAFARWLALTTNRYRFFGKKEDS